MELRAGQRSSSTALELGCPACSRKGILRSGNVTSPEGCAGRSQHHFNLSHQNRGSGGTLPPAFGLKGDPTAE